MEPTFPYGTPIEFIWVHLKGFKIKIGIGTSQSSFPTTTVPPPMHTCLLLHNFHQTLSCRPYRLLWRPYQCTKPWHRKHYRWTLSCEYCINFFLPGTGNSGSHITLDPSVPASRYTANKFSRRHLVNRFVMNPKVSANETHSDRKATAERRWPSQRVDEKGCNQHLK